MQSLFPSFMTWVMTKERKSDSRLILQPTTTKINDTFFLWIPHTPMILFIYLRFLVIRLANLLRNVIQSDKNCEIFDSLERLSTISLHNKNLNLPRSHDYKVERPNQQTLERTLIKTSRSKHLHIISAVPPSNWKHSSWWLQFCTFRITSLSWVIYYTGNKSNILLRTSQHAVHFYALFVILSRLKLSFEFHAAQCAQSVIIKKTLDSRSNGFSP